MVLTKRPYNWGVQGVHNTPQIIPRNPPVRLKIDSNYAGLLKILTDSYSIAVAPYLLPEFLLCLLHAELAGSLTHL